jgi:4-amino-4-deoxy-L-arabinose transferase-like glycosyltransferase
MKTLPVRAPGMVWMGLAVIVLLGAWLFRAHYAFGDHRFHPDEALFATFARQAAVNGNWLFSGPLDKTPLALYAQAVSMTFAGVVTNDAGVLDLGWRAGEMAARFPSLLAGTVFVALMLRIGRDLGRRSTPGIWAGLLAACSPLLIGFSGSAFTDMLMLACGAGAMLACLRGHWLAGGLLIGMAFLCKQQGVLLAPLCLMLPWALGRLNLRGVVRFALGAAAGLMLLLAWEAARAAPVGVLALAAANNAPDLGRLSVPGAPFWPLRYLLGILGGATAVFLVLIPISFVARLAGRRGGRPLALEALLLGFIIVYTLGHVVAGANTYDRYVLPLLPPLILLAVRAGLWIHQIIAWRLMRQEAQLAAAAVAFALIVSALDAASGRFGYVSQTTSFPDAAGIEQVAEYLEAQHVAAVVYDHWLNWQLGFYMGEWSDKRRTYYPDPESLARDAALLEECEDRFLPVPPGASARPWLEALEAIGFSTQAAFRANSYVVYRLTPPRAGRCAEAAWRHSPGASGGDTAYVRPYRAPAHSPRPV